MLTKSLDFESNVNKSERIIEGYASTWDKDSVDDVIKQGAFAKSIREGLPAKRIKMLWQHKYPLGMPLEMTEDSKGLYAKARVSKTRLGDEALELMSDGVVDRMSIGFTIPQGKSICDAKGVRIISEVKLMEFSPVTFPANENAAITAVKSLTDAIAAGDKLNSSELAKALASMKALIESLEPLFSTQEDEQPPKADEAQPSETDELENMVKSWAMLPELLKKGA